MVTFQVYFGVLFYIFSRVEYVFQLQAEYIDRCTYIIIISHETWNACPTQENTNLIHELLNAWH